LLAPLLAQLRKAAGFFGSLTLEWVPREDNQQADAESRAAYMDVTGHEPPDRARKVKLAADAGPLVGAALQFEAPRSLYEVFPRLDWEGTP
jgi:hypothetical protein